MMQNKSKEEALLRGSDIIIFDEGRSFSLGIALLLKNYLCETRICGNIEEALQQLAKKPSDILIGDINFLAIIKNENAFKNLPFILILNPADTDSLTNAFSLGANAILDKGNIKNFLLPEITTLMELVKLRQKVKHVHHFAALTASMRACKHDLANVLGILDLKINKLEKAFPEIASHETHLNLKNTVTRLEGILETASEITEEIEDL